MEIVAKKLDTNKLQTDKEWIVYLQTPDGTNVEAILCYDSELDDVIDSFKYDRNILKISISTN